MTFSEATAAGDPPLLEMRNIGKAFPGVKALNGVSFTLHAGEIHALVGENGAGKSTLMKVLSGVYPTNTFEGEILLEGKAVHFHSIHASGQAGISVIHQELALVPEMTAAENIFLGEEPGRMGLVDQARASGKARILLAALGFTLEVDVPVRTLSVGEQQLVEIARALRKESRILVLDEPTASLSQHETDQLLGLIRTLASHGKSVVYISHKLDEVFTIADRITVLRDGTTVGTRPTASWDRKSLITAMVGRSLGEMYLRSAAPRGEPRLQVAHLTVQHPARQDALLLDDISFTAYGGETLGVAGLMGSGRTGLLLTLFGRPPGLVLGGTVSVRGRAVSLQSPADAIKAGLALVPEDRKYQGLVLGLSVMRNLGLAHLKRFSPRGIVNEPALHHFAADAAKTLDIRTPSLQVEAGTLSGGNQQKVVLGKWLAGTPSVMFLDEPTRGIDVGAKAEIYRLINWFKAQGLAVVVVSSDLPEIVGIADRVVVMREGRLTADLAAGAITQERIMEHAT